LRELTALEFREVLRPSSERREEGKRGKEG